MKSLLFICWDGPQVNYLEGLFFPILRGLTGEYNVHVLQFTWGETGKSEKIQQMFADADMTYERVDVARGPLRPAGIALTLIKGSEYLRRYIRTQKIDILLPRSTFPAIMTLRQAHKPDGPRWVFDADGLPLEERVDFSGLSKDSLQYRIFKMAEKAMVRQSDAILVRSEAAIPFLTTHGEVSREKFHVVVNGRDPALFRPLEPDRRAQIRQELGLPEGGIVLSYCGSLGPQYCVPEMFALLEKMLDRALDAWLLILTGSPEWIEQAAPNQKVRQRLLVRTLPFAEVPPYLGAADVGLAIRQPSPSMKAVAPVKIGEYLLCGLPVVASPGIGDTEQVLTEEDSCLVLRDHSPDALDEAARWIAQVTRNGSIQTAARKAGLSGFSLEKGVSSYKAALKTLGEPE